MDTKYRIAPKFIFRDVEDEAVVLLPETDTLFALSASAKILWKEMMNNENSMTYSKMLKTLMDYYDVSLSDAEQDTKAFISKMVNYKIFEVI